MIDVNTIPKQKSEKWVRNIDSVQVYNNKSDKVFTLNFVGARIWELSDGQHTVEQIIQDLSSNFNVTPAEVKEDVIRFLEEMHNEKIIEL